MPLQPVTNTLHMSTETEVDVQRLFEEGLQLVRHPSRVRRENGARDLEDHFFYVGALRPHLARALQPDFARLSDEQLKIFSFTFETWLHLLHGADDECVETLVDKLLNQPDNYQRQMMLAAIGTPVALEVFAAFVRDHGLATEFESLGFHVPAERGSAQPRFTIWRQAIKVSPFDGSQAELKQEINPVGLPLSCVIVPSRHEVIRWHYLSVDRPDGENFPARIPRRLHLVSPCIDIGWTLFCSILPGGRYVFHSVTRDDDDGELDELLDERTNADPFGLATATFVPYDDSLVYCNGHVMSTAGVVGTVGGPPIGLYPNPTCPLCHVLMFHILTVEAGIRDYGDGWRSLFVCETCSIAACNATSWN